MDIQRIKLKKLSNTRDIGGFSAADGKKIAPCKLIRSGELNGAAPEDIAVLKEQYRLEIIIDLRMDAEREQSPDPVIDGVTTLVLPVLDGSFFGIARDENSVSAWLRLFEDPNIDPREIFKTMYRKLLFSDYVKPLYRELFSVLLEPREGAVLWHCSAGKDRAGLVSLLVMTALGVPRELIIRDYMMTETFTAKDLRKAHAKIRVFIRDKRKKNCLNVLLSVDESYLTQLFDIMDAEYGGGEGYLRSFVGISQEEILRLREMYLV